jgi:hypothetical protein
MERTEMTVRVQSRCAACLRGEPVGYHRGAFVHSVRDHEGVAAGVPPFRCLNFDDECRPIGEPLGYYTFALFPVRCLNRRWRWFCWVERHNNGTYTLGNRAH